jgi:hypothetical protein
VARGFVVESETGARVPHLGDAAGVFDPVHRRGDHTAQRPLRVVDRVQRVHRQQVFDVGEQQLLVLLLVLQAELHQLTQLGVVRARQQGGDARVHVRAVGLDFGQARPRDQAALRARVLLAHALVVAVEQHPKAGVEGLEAGLKTFQHEGLEEPRHVGQVPFGGAGIRHGLHLAVGLAQGLGQRERLGAHAGVAPGQVGGCGLGGGGRGHRGGPFSEALAM